MTMPVRLFAFERWRRTLNAWIVFSNDQGRAPEDSAIVLYYQQRMQEQYGERIRLPRQEWGVPE